MLFVIPFTDCAHKAHPLNLQRRQNAQLVTSMLRVLECMCLSGTLQCPTPATNSNNIMINNGCLTWETGESLMSKGMKISTH